MPSPSERSEQGARRRRFVAAVAIAALSVVAALPASAQTKSKQGAKTQKAPTKPAAAAPAGRAPVTLLETREKPATDYEAEVYAGVALDDGYAKDRGLSKGLVSMVFEKSRRAAFRVPHEKIKKLVRFAAEDGAPILLVKASPAKTKVDVIETDEGWIAVETVTSSGGIFTTSDVYVFAKGASLDQRLGALGTAPPSSRERLRRALAIAASAKP